MFEHGPTQTQAAYQSGGTAGIIVTSAFKNLRFVQSNGNLDSGTYGHWQNLGKVLE
jgi:hypothetical protein